MVQVKSMKKVQVAVALTDAGGSEAAPEDAVNFSFIYGIGKDGLSPFECLLEGCRQGDITKTEVGSEAISAFFGGLFGQVQSLFEGKILPYDLCFCVEIIKVEEVENREVVAALAGSVSGCGGSCGCGCS